MPDREQLLALARTESSPAVSIFLPARHDMADPRQGAVRLRNALAAAEEQLLALGQRRPEIDAMLRPARALEEDRAFWRDSRDSLAIFIGPDLYQLQTVPLDLAEVTMVGRRPNLRPLLPLLTEDRRFHVLTVTADAARLLAGDALGLRELDAPLPGSTAEVAAETEYENTRHAAPAARPRQGAPIGMPATHNFGETPEEQRKTQLVEHLRRLASAVDAALRGDKAPLVLVAQPEIEGHFRALSGRLPLVEGSVQTDPASLSDGELHRRALEVAGAALPDARAAAVERFQALAGSGDGRATADLAAIMAAAHAGRIDTLLIADTADVRGSYDPAADALRLDPEPGPTGVDLAEAAAIETLSQGGTVHMLPAADMPAEAPLAGILRY